MLTIRIEMDRGNGWEVRQHGHIAGERSAFASMLRAGLRAYCIQYPHRALIDGEVVAEDRP